MELTELQEIINRHGRNLKQEIGLALSEQEAKDIIKSAVSEVYSLHVVGSSLPDLAECNQASLDYATKKNNPDFFLIKQTFKDGVNWALNYVTRPK
jgi:hypothetical protein|tara:strand:- start:387 stop:674 length:288 start_codon:yes stop_codon:yes gene_type:complete